MSKNGSRVVVHDTRYGGDVDSHLSIPGIDAKFMIDKRPVILHASGPVCEYLVESDVSKYLEFRHIAKHGFISQEGTIMIPLSKEDIFMDSSLSLIEKRKLAKIVNFPENQDPRQIIGLIDDLPERLRKAFVHGILATDSTITDVEQVQRSLQIYKSGISRYGAPLLYTVYGSSEIPQAFCRQAAVHGTTFILGDGFEISDNTFSFISRSDRITGKFDRQIENAFKDECHRVVMVTDSPIMGVNDASIWTIAIGTQIIRALCIGHDTGCAPVGHWIVHVWSKSDIDKDTLLSILSIEPSNYHYFEGPTPIYGPEEEQRLLDRSVTK